MIPRTSELNITDCLKFAAIFELPVLRRLLYFRSFYVELTLRLPVHIVMDSIGHLDG